MLEETVAGEGGVKIFVRSWRPEAAPRAAVVIVHGFNSHSGQYQWAAEQLTAMGLAVYAADLRGRGKSEGERFYLDEFAEYVADAGLAVAMAKSREPGLPVFLLGHSAGGIVACTYALENQADLAGLICESFAYQVPAPDIALTVLKGASYIAPHAHVLKLNNADFSRDPAVVKAMNEDPLIAGESQATKTVAELVRAVARLKDEFARITLPVLILHGTEDKATKPTGSQYFYDHAGSPDKTLKLYEGHFHDLLADLGKEGVMADIKAWIAARLPMA